MEQEFAYIVRLTFRNRPHFLLWQEGLSGPDSFILLPNTSLFLMASTKQRLLENAAKFGLIVSTQRTESLDVDKVFKVLHDLHAEARVMQSRCELLLFAWNMFQDMDFSIKANPSKLSTTKKNILHKAYEKLFWGNNLPSVTPQGQSYHPMFSAIELKYVREFFSQTWQRIGITTGQFN